MSVDLGWLSALKLPTKVVAGLLLASAILFALNYLTLFDLSVFGGMARPVTIVVLIVAACLLLASIGAEIYEARVTEPRKVKSLAGRRAAGGTSRRR